MTLSILKPLGIVMTIAANTAFTATNGPLKISTVNSRYFEDSGGNIVYLTGSHTWASLQERGIEGDTPDFDYTGYVDNMVAWGHNFMRMWCWEHATWMQFTDTKVRYKPNPYLRTGPGTALDGGSKFDLTQFNQEYFDRLRARVIEARDKGIYVSVMLFQGFSVQQKSSTGSIDPNVGDQWKGHPFNAANNIQGWDGDPDGDGRGYEVHTLSTAGTMGQLRARQEAYVRKVIETVGDLDNVLYEIGNEMHGGSQYFQYHMINLIKEYEQSRSLQHPVGMTFQADQIDKGTNDMLYDSPADWISTEDDFEDPPAASGGKVSLIDTDHVRYWTTDPKWPWYNFTRGHNPLIMDMYCDYRGFPEGTTTPDPSFADIRNALGYTRQCAGLLDLSSLLPLGGLASTGYCLASPGNAYLAYLPAGGSVTVDLTAVDGDLSVQWFNCGSGGIIKGNDVAGGASRQLTAPFTGHAAVILQATAPGTTAAPDLARGLQAHWNMDAPDGTTVPDVSGNGNDGTLCNGTSSDDGISGQAVNLDGDDDRVDLPFILDPAGTDFSLSAWVYLETAGAMEQIILVQEDGNGTGRVWLGRRAEGDLFCFLGGSDHNGTAELTTSAWHHVALTVRYGVIRTYLDNALQATAAPTIESSDGSLRLGNHKDGLTGRGWNGRIDEVRIYDRALTAEEIGLLAVHPTAIVPRQMSTDGNIRPTSPVRYDLNGRTVSKTAARPGIYLERTGDVFRKVLVR